MNVKLLHMLHDQQVIKFHCVVTGRSFIIQLAVNRTLIYLGRHLYPQFRSAPETEEPFLSPHCLVQRHSSYEI